MLKCFWKRSNYIFRICHQDKQGAVHVFSVKICQKKSSKKSQDCSRCFSRGKLTRIRAADAIRSETRKNVFRKK